MNRSSLVLAGLVLSLATFSGGCKKDCDCPTLPYNNPSNPSPNPVSNSGTVTFWNNESNVGQITVYVDGSYSGTISKTKSASSCNESGCANFTLSYGSHSYTATSTTGETWNSSFTLSSNCLLYQLR